MQVQTTRFGPLETLDLPDDAALLFPDGLPGFEQHSAFALVEDRTYLPFCWLQSLADPNVRFLMVDPAVVDPDYHPTVTGSDADALALEAGDAFRVYAILVARDDLRTATANLKAPVLVNWPRKLGRQVILMDDRYGLRHPLVPADSAAPSRGELRADACSS
ncbi:MAG: flagellar assembly protein FliW [Chloroflexi bacterium]|nr:flagellar assembly protein FliW [Chloroflexota bacterium]